MKRKPLYMLLALLLAAAFAGYFMYARKTPDAVQGNADYKMPAYELTQAFEKDGVAAGKRFSGKVIRVSGKVKSISNAGAIVLESKGSASEVAVGLDGRHKEDMHKIKAGAQVVLQGVYSGYEQGEGSAGDLLARLGTTVQLRSAGLREGEQIKAAIKPGYMKIIRAVLPLLLLSIVAGAQGRFYTKTGTISFLSKAPMENIEAFNKTVTAVLDAPTGAMQFAVQMKGFEFRKALMQQHFNENYVESDKYPKAEFKGALADKAAVAYDKEGTYKVMVKGRLTLHGVTKEVQASGTIQVQDGRLQGKSTFNIQLSDYNIAIPALVKDKVAGNIAITIDLDLEPLKG